MMKPASTSLYCLLARKAPIGLIFRRGPSHHVQLIKWNLDEDTFEEGQWFKGRIYERRCDLSPNGTLLIYFAANYKEPLRSWTAISKPPWLTALALWPKGDGWNGGGCFTGSSSIELNHPDFMQQAAPHPDHVLGCQKFKIEQYARRRGEDATVWHKVLIRDGWQLVQESVLGSYEEVKGYRWKARIPELWRKSHPTKNIHLEMSVEAIGRKNGTWYVLHYRVLNDKFACLLDLGELDWADWDSKKDLVFSKQGRLYRQPVSSKGVGVAKQIADFTGNRFEAIISPASAKKSDASV